MKTTGIANLFESARSNPWYYIQGAILDFTEDVVDRMSALGVSKSDLARKLECKPAYITKMLGGDTNFTLVSMVKVAMALDTEVRIHLQPKEASTYWIHEIKGKQDDEIQTEAWSSEASISPLKVDFQMRRVSDAFNHEECIPA